MADSSANSGSGDSSGLLHTPCHDWHVARGARMVDFAGWEMPVQYTSITEEHHAVRNAAGLFDISHMGRLQFTGPDACACLDHLVTNDVTKLGEGRVRYALVTNEQGGVLDDVLVYRFAGFYLMVVNASNREKILGWIEQHRGGFDVQVEDLTFERCMVAVQGPQAAEVLGPLADDDIAPMKYYRAAEGTVLGAPALLSRTGYTGEDGFEVILPADKATALCDELLQRGEERGLKPAGLGCRDTLRLEAAMPLYGHELDESIDPLTAGLEFAVKLQAGEFLGKEALTRIAADASRRRRVGLELQGRRIAREGALLFSGDDQIGRVTSGTFSPTLQKAIAMGYVEPGSSDPGTGIEVDIRGKRQQARVVALPFYRRT